MIEDGGSGCDEELSSQSNGNPLRRQWGQKERNFRWRRKRRQIRNATNIFLIVTVTILYFCTDKKRIQRPTESMVHVASFAPPFAPRLTTVSNDNMLLRTSHSTNLSSKKKLTTILKMISSTSTVNTTSLSTGLSTISPDKRETKLGTTPIKAPIRVSSGNKYIPPGELDQLLDKVDIISLIESYDLQGFQRTSSLKATCLCPFHDDNNPSLQINGERGIYKCFSCGAGGNALKFVREYSNKYPEETRRLKSGIVDSTNIDKPLTFVEAVRVLQDSAANFPMVGGVPMRQWSGGDGNSTNARGTRMKKKASRQKIGSTPRERILHANLFAAAYFEESLFGLPSAGSARTHLRSRGVHPTTVKAFAIGFAPETYFSGGASKQGSRQKRMWGEGSLVNRLREEGFTPQEILDSGLAIVTRKGKEQQKQEKSKVQRGHDNKTSSDAGSDQEHKDYSTLMDRFRGRLVVPIFDARGAHVLGFGGRILEASQDANTDFKAAKYLNSPESLVFRKKELLFGQHMVKLDSGATNAATAGSNKETTKVVAQRRQRSLIIVEGYMDAIALWQAGIQEAVASMGTALTKEQLLAAAEQARDMGGK